MGITLDDKLELLVDRIAISRIATDLAWAVENTSVVALHQIGEALEDNMGIDVDK